MSKKIYKMILDSAGERNGLLASRKTYLLDKKFGDKLVKDGRAVEYNIDTADRIVIVDGEMLTWGDYLRKIRENSKFRNTINANDIPIS